MFINCFFFKNDWYLDWQKKMSAVNIIEYRTSIWRTASLMGGEERSKSRAFLLFVFVVAARCVQLMCYGHHGIEIIWIIWKTMGSSFRYFTHELIRGGKICCAHDTSVLWNSAVTIYCTACTRASLIVKRINYNGIWICIS